MEAQRALVFGCGNMGSSHARAYHKNPGFELVALVDRNLANRERTAEACGGVAQFDDFAQALEESRPDVVAICTYPDSHAALAKQALEAGAHLFIEKPLATTAEEAREIADLALTMGRKLVVGYILRVHPAWQRFIELAQGLGKPLVMRMNLNQQSSGKDWKTHRGLMQSISPIVDCGVHYVDVMCQMTRSRPVQVSAIGARLSDEIAEDMYNYGQLQVRFEDGSVGWYEAGWGPMMSQTAYFVKDVIGPHGSVSITEKGGVERKADSSDIDSHTKTNTLLLHHGGLDAEGDFQAEDQYFDMSDEPDHDELCAREQDFLLAAIREDRDLREHLDDAVSSLRIVLAADESFRSGRSIEL